MMNMEHATCYMLNFLHTSQNSPNRTKQSSQLATLSSPWRR